MAKIKATSSTVQITRTASLIRIVYRVISFSNIYIVYVYVRILNTFCRVIMMNAQPLNPSQPPLNPLLFFISLLLGKQKLDSDHDHDHAGWVASN